MRPARPEPHTMAGAYAMDALDDRDRARFERHLAHCQECGQEITGLREATARLAAAAAARPPAAVKERLLAATALTRQLRPGTTGPSQHPPWRLDLPRPGRLPSQSQRNRRRVRAPKLVLALALAGIFFIAAAAVWVTGSTRQSPLAQEPPHSHEIAAVLTAPDATMISARVRTGGTVTVVMSHRERMLVFTAAGLRALAASRRYELWLMGPETDRPAGLLPVPRQGMTGPVITPGLEPGDRLGLTVEPASGSRHPTSAMIMVVTL